MGMYGQVLAVNSEEAKYIEDRIRKFATGELFDEDVLPDALDLGKAWHGLHFLLTGTAWEGVPPLNFRIDGGREVVLGDVPYRFFVASEVAELSGLLPPVEEATARFQAGEMDRLEIYPEGPARARPASSSVCLTRKACFSGGQR